MLALSVVGMEERDILWTVNVSSNDP